MLKAVCKFNAQLISVSLTWMTDILTMCSTLPSGNSVEFLYVYEYIYTSVQEVSLMIVLGTYMHTNVFIYVHISTFIISNVDIGMQVWRMENVKQLLIRNVSTSQGD